MEPDYLGVLSEEREINLTEVLDVLGVIEFEDLDDWLEHLTKVLDFMNTIFGEPDGRYLVFIFL